MSTLLLRKQWRSEIQHIWVRLNLNPLLWNLLRLPGLPRRPHRRRWVSPLTGSRRSSWDFRSPSRVSCYLMSFMSSTRSAYVIETCDTQQPQAQSLNFMSTKNVIISTAAKAAGPEISARKQKELNCPAKSAMTAETYSASSHQPEEEVRLNEYHYVLRRHCMCVCMRVCPTNIVSEAGESLCKLFSSIFWRLNLSMFCHFWGEWILLSIRRWCHCNCVCGWVDGCACSSCLSFHTAD